MTSSYDPTAIDAAAAYPPSATPVTPAPVASYGTHSSGAPGAGVLIVGLGWLVLAAAMVAIGGPVFFGIFEAVGR